MLCVAVRGIGAGDDVALLGAGRHARGGAGALHVHDHGRNFGEVRKTDEFGHVRLGGIGNTLAAEIESRTGFETRAVVLGHTQRGGSPTAFDRMLATRYGIGAIDLVHEGKFGHMVALKGSDITSVPIADAISRTRYVGKEFIDVASSLREKHSEQVSSSK